MKTVHYLSMLGDKPNLCDESKEAVVRALFIDQFVDPSANLRIDAGLVSQECVTGDLYIGSHQCVLSDEIDDVYIELWAFRDEPDSDYLGWRLMINGEEHSAPIWFCPMCGLNLESLITTLGCDD